MDAKAFWAVIGAYNQYHIPCLVASLSIAVYAGYRKKNKILPVLLTIWGLTDIKSVLFSAYGDLILLACGLYGTALLIREARHKK